jgi:L-alanine-DL-glutamate epimerase-like enolase superfamily enzyme
MKLRLRTESWPLLAPARITGHTFTRVEVVVVRLEHKGRVGRGEAAGVYYHDESAATLALQIEAARNHIEAGIDRAELQNLLPAGGARNALDCALWDLESGLASRPVWQLAGFEAPRPLLTTCTIGAGEPGEMAQSACKYSAARALKLKLIGDSFDAARVMAVRAARPDVWLGVDANQGLTPDSLDRLLPTLIAARVALIEQPFAIGQEALLDGFASPIAIAADESAQDVTDLPKLSGRFDVVNIKLDKCGGLTEGLAMAAQARQLGFKIMVGNMFGTSLAMAPAFLLGQACEIVDLDGPLALLSDRSPCVSYANGHIDCPSAVWGHGRA